MATNVDGILAGVKRVSTEPLAYVQDFAGGNVPIYIGEASPGTVTSVALWRIQKRTYDASGKLTKIEWADGNGQFDNEWDERAISVVYS